MVLQAKTISKHDDIENVPQLCISQLQLLTSRPRGIFLEGEMPTSRAKIGCNRSPGGKIACGKALKPHPLCRTITQALTETYETALTTHIFDDVLIQKGISNSLFGSICFKTIILITFLLI